MAQPQAMRGSVSSPSFSSNSLNQACEGRDLLSDSKVVADAGLGDTHANSMLPVPTSAVPLVLMPKEWGPHSSGEETADLSSLASCTLPLPRPCSLPQLLLAPRT